MVRSLIIDDEKHCCDNLQWQLGQYCPDIKVLGCCNSGEKAIDQINQLRPELIFLDVEMPGMTGFEMLEKIVKIDFDIIFTTGFDQYAIRAIKFGALDYLVKPIDKDELLEAVTKLNGRSQGNSIKQLTALLTHIRKSNDLSFQKIALPTLHGYELVPINNIMLCVSNS